MKKFLLFTGLLLFVAFSAFSQYTIVFTEGFETPSLADSLISTQQAVPGTDDWGINTRMHQGVGSLRSDTCQVKTGKTCYLTSLTFSTVGNANVELSFGHVCKVDPLDLATIEVSNNGGTSWIQLTGAQYLGTGSYANNGNKFASSSYGAVWSPASASALPLINWFRTEKFDVSMLIGNCPTAKFRFKLADLATPGPGGVPPNVNNNRGWYIDNVSVKMSYSELLAPAITLKDPIWTGVTYNTGPYQVKAKVTDFSGLDTVMLVYKINNGLNDTVGMVFFAPDTSYRANLPVMADSSQVCYYVIAFDASPAHNFATNPLPASCVSLTFYAPFVIPYNDNFDAANSLWEAGPATNGSQWQWGVPNFGATNSTHSPPKAWDVNLSAAYANSASCTVLSPPLNFSTAFNARLSFWYNYKTENDNDGFWLEYSTDGGTVWNILGDGPTDPLGVNWYTTASLDFSGDPAWEDNSGGWKQAKYKLSVLNNQTNYVRFRFVFYSDGFTPGDGVSIDDFTIVLPAPQEAAADKVMAPATGCGLGMETVKVRIINNGLTPITNGLTASYKRDASSATVTEPVTQTIPAGDTIVFTFAQPVDLSTVGVDVNFNLKTWVTLANDPNHGDDTTFKAITSQYVPIPPAVSSQLIAYGTLTTLTATSTLPVTWYSDCIGTTILGTGTTLTTPILYGLTIYYPKVVAPNGCISNCAQDTVYVSSPPPFDGAALTILSPTTTFNMSSAEIVKVRIRNYGTSNMSNFPIKYKVTGPNNTNCLTEVFTNTLLPGDTVTYTFTCTANLSAYGVYSFKAWVEVPGDLNQVNDTAFKTVENKFFVYCTSAAGSTADEDIGNVLVSNLDNGIGTPNLSNPLANKTYTDFTSLSPILMSRGLVYPISVTAIMSAGFYASWVEVYVDWDYSGDFDEATETVCSMGSTTTTNFTLTGNIDVPLNAHLGLTRLRVVLQENGSTATVHPCGSYGYGETEDYLVHISPQLHNDAGVTSITNPPATYPEGILSPISVTVKNFGLDTIFPSTMNISYIMDNNVASLVTMPYTLKLDPSASGTFPFPAIALPSGNHTVTAWTTLPVTDTNSFNDTSSKAIYGIPIDPLPYYDNFDGPVNFTTSSTGGTNWILGAPVTTVFPNDAHSAPNCWGTNLNVPGGQYTNNANCSLVTQLFTFNNAMNAKLSFWQKRHSQNLNDGCILEYSTNNGNSWTILGSQGDPNATGWYNGIIAATSGPAWTGNTATWVKSTYKLAMFNTPFLGEVRFRFRFVSNGFTTDNGMFIDDFQIFNPYMTDAGIDSIYKPHGTDAAGYPGQVKVRLNNFSRTPITSVNISYQIGTQAPVTELWTGNLAPGDTVPYTFNTTFGIPQGDYCLKAYTSLPNDSALINDTSYKCAFGIPVFEIPFDDHFDSLTSYWYTSGPQWERGTPTGTPTSINTPYTQPNCWKTKIAGPYNLVYAADLLYSPMFNLSYGYDSLTFMHWVDVYNNDKAWVEYLGYDINGNKVWKKLGNIGDPNGVNWYNSGASGFVNNGGLPGWHRSGYDLKILTDIANPAQFRFHFYCYYNNNHTPINAGWAVDNFELTTPRIPQDAGVISILQPVAAVTYGTNLEVKVRIQNFGTDTLTSIPVKYSINGTTVAANNWTGSLLPDSTIDFTFPFIDSPLASFDLCAYTDVPFDTKLDNDTTCMLLSVIPPQYDVSITEIISPVTPTIHFNEATVTVKIKNFGFQQVSSIPVEYRVADNAIVVNETWNGTLNQNEEAIFTFSQKYSHEFLGWYYLCVLTNLPDDGYTANDTICTKLEEKWTYITENEGNGLYMAQNYPNPCDESAEIEYIVPGAGDVTFNLVNYLGQRLIEKTEKVTQGEHKFIINTSKLPQGLYYYFIEYEGKRMIRKMVVTH